MQTSFMYEFTNNSSTINGTLRGEWYIQSASITGSSGTSTGYDSWSTPKSISGDLTITGIDNATLGSKEGGAKTLVIGNNTTPAGGVKFTSAQGYYVRIYMIVSRSSNGNVSDIIKLKSFVYRTSRVVGGSIAPAPQGEVS